HYRGFYGSPPIDSAERRSDFRAGACNGSHTVSALAQMLHTPARAPFDGTAALELAAAPDLRSGLDLVLARARIASRAERVEWWEGGELVAVDGLGSGIRREVELGTFGTFVFHGGRLGTRLAADLRALLPLLRRLRADETLAVRAGELARRNGVLKD